MFRVLTDTHPARGSATARSSTRPRVVSLTRFSANNRGNVAMSFGLMIFVMMGFVGASIDMGRWLLARKQTQEAIDSAILAGLRKYQESGSTTDAIAMAKVNYNYSVAQNGRGLIGTNTLLFADTIGFVLQNNNTRMTATGDVWVKTPFIGIATKAFSKSSSSIAILPLLKTDGSENAVTEIAVGGNAGTNLEVSVMIDITGSMEGSDNAGSTKIATVRDAAKELVDILVWTDQSTYTSKVAIVPFSEAVNLGTPAQANIARGTYSPGASSTPGSAIYTVSGQSLVISDTCVTERLGSEAYTDTAPQSAPVGRLYQSSPECPTSTAVMPLSNNKTALKNMIGGLTTGGYTAGHMGTAWAWYTLSPNFNSLWSASAGAKPYAQLTTLSAAGKPVLRKIAILMTDGEYNTEYCKGVLSDDNGSGRGIDCNPTNGKSADQALKLCTGMKAKGIEVYTIGSQVNNNSKTMLKKCATDASHYYDAENGTQLKQAFMDIAYKLVPPYITH